MIGGFDAHEFVFRVGSARADAECEQQREENATRRAGHYLINCSSAAVYPSGV